MPRCFLYLGWLALLGGCQTFSSKESATPIHLVAPSVESKPPSGPVSANTIAPAAMLVPIPVAPPPPVDGVGAVRVAGEAVSFDEVVRLSGVGDPLPGVGGGCATCGGAAGGSTCDGGCEPYPATTAAGRVFGSFYDALCCPDPCYRPKWEPLADTAFVTAAARPITQTRLQWNYTSSLNYPDRGEYYWARSDGRGRGVTPQFGARSVGFVDQHELMQVTEAATGKASISVATPYRSVNPQFAGSQAGFSDVIIGAKSLLLDSELLLAAFQFNTFIPSGNAGKGLGTGHVSLEPSVILGLRLGPQSFLQVQIAEWIPLGGDSTYSGAMLHYHLAYNQVLWKPTEKVQLIGTAEAHGYSFQDGGFTDPTLGFRKASDHTSGQLGTGARLFICDKYDLGVGGVWGITGANQLGSQLRVEARVRY